MFIVPCFAEVMQKAGGVTVCVGLGLLSPSTLIIEHKLSCLNEGVFPGRCSECDVLLIFPRLPKEITKKLWGLKFTF